jgi:hypothetical protein
LKRTRVSYSAPSSFIELISVNWPGSSDVGSATSPTTSTPGVAAAGADAGAALVRRGTTVEASAETARPAPTVRTKPRREMRCEFKDATPVPPFPAVAGTYNARSTEPH